MMGLVGVLNVSSADMDGDPRMLGEGGLLRSVRINLSCRFDHGTATSGAIRHMPRLEIDPDIERIEQGGFAFPLGLRPLAPLTPKSGYLQEFEAADGSEPFLTGPETADWEEWPDRFMFDVLLPGPRVPAFVRLALTLFPARVYPILDVLGNDAYREIDPYIAYDLVGLDKFVEGVRQFGPWLFEDGLCGFGALSIEPFVYLFVDEHKLVTLRVQLDLKEKVERLLAAFELTMQDHLESVDSVEHEHRTVLLSPPDDPKLLSGQDILDRLRSLWLLQLNIAGDTNLDDDGRELGTTGWECLVRCLPADGSGDRFAHVILTADCLDEAEVLAAEAVQSGAPDGGWGEVDPYSCNRILPNELEELVQRPSADMLAGEAVHSVKWLSHPVPDERGNPDNPSGEGAG